MSQNGKFEFGEKSMLITSLWSIGAIGSAVAGTYPIDLSTSKPTVQLGIADLASGSIALDFSGSDIVSVKSGKVACGPLREGTLDLGNSPCFEGLGKPGTEIGTLSVLMSSHEVKSLKLNFAEGDARSTVLCSGTVKAGSEREKACGSGGDKGINLSVRSADKNTGKITPGSGQFQGLQVDNLFYWDPRESRWRSAGDLPEGALTLETKQIPAGNPVRWLTLSGDMMDRLESTGSATFRAVSPLSSSGRHPPVEVIWEVVDSDGFDQAPNPDISDIPVPQDWCEKYRTQYEHVPYILCVDMSADHSADWTLYSRYDAGSKKFTDPFVEQYHNFILPNRSVMVVVRSPKADRLTLSHAPTAQISLDVGTIVTDEFVAEGARAGVAERSQSGGKQVHTYLVAPRSSGGHTLTFKLEGATSANGTTTWTERFSWQFELLVLKKKVAALRTGVGITVPFGSPQTYTEAGLPGQDGEQIAALDIQPGTELLVALAPFVFSRGGRVQAPDRAELEGVPVSGSVPHRGLGEILAPYVGFGLQPGATEAVVDSYHAGLDVDLARGLSVQVGGFLRENEEILPPYEVGMSVDSGDNYTETSGVYGGYAVFVSVTPWFFRQVPGLGLGNVGEE